MHTLAIYEGYVNTNEGDTLITFCIPEAELTEKLNKLEGERVTLDIAKWSEKRSLSANNYLWQLCTKVAAALHTDKDSVYLMMLRNYGVFQDLKVIKAAIPTLKQAFRLVETFDDGYASESDEVYVRCYFGSSKYDKDQMRVLINGCVSDAEILGIDTWSQDEVERLISEWEAQR